MRYEWDDVKAASNLTKHGISFEEASTVFDDPYARVIDDPDQSLDEDRFIILGMSAMARELVVSHCVRGRRQDIIRIISARRATRTETAQYWRFIHA